MTIARRAILAGLAGSAVAYAPAAWAQPAPVRARVFGNRTPASVASYKRTVLAMLALPAADPRNWYRQALIHILDCPHASWWFLPWHRGYLFQFERICAQQSGDAKFRLPYWDWTASPSVPLAFFDPELDCGGAHFYQAWARFQNDIGPALRTWWSGLSTARRQELAKREFGSADDVLAFASQNFESGHGRRDPSRQHPQLDPRAASVVTETYMKSVLKPGAFADFASGKTPSHHEHGDEGPLESGPHDNVHGFTGGYMGAYLSPVDPLFWLHHANLDRVWDIWTRRQKAAGRTGLPAGGELAQLKAEPFLFFCDERQTPLDKTAGDYLDTGALGYSYEAGSAETLSAPNTALAFTQSREIVRTGFLNKLLRTSLETSAAVAVAPSVLSETVRDESKDLFAKVSITPPPQANDVHVRVYMNCPYLSHATPVSDAHYVGTISFFAALHRTGAMPMTFTLPLGPTLDRLHSAGRLPKSAIKVQLITDGPAGKSLAAAALNGVVIDSR